MARGLEDIRNTLARITQGETILDILYEFERTMDMAGLRAYKNWYKGELVNGPEISKYWVKCTFMYPHKYMPDPNAGMRLKKIGCKIGFEESTFKKPVKIHSPADWEDKEFKRAKMKSVPVWLVHIEMPMKYITDNFDDINAYLNETPEPTYDEEAQDYDDAEQAFDELGDIE